ncbi:MAG: penicillin-binding protein 2 [Pseudomonadota bacterium]|nr:penicillin-binding protein 2 [Pseudomonadota bacterium]MEE3295434.1 penicillin-binding protein 2 [Pseudomonadota bacterium]
MNEKRGNFRRIVVGNDISYLFRRTHQQKYNNPVFQESIKIGRERVRFAINIFLALFLIFSVRNTFLSIFPGDVIGNTPIKVEIHQIRKPRPDVLDREGKIIATTVKTIRASLRNPKYASESAIKLAPILNKDPKILEDQLMKSGSYFELANDISDKERYKLLNAGVAEIEFNNVWRRIYPNKTLASHIIGYSQRDLKGGAGFERTISYSGIASSSINLSIDLRIQNHLETELSKGMKEYNAKAAFGIIMNAKNGEIIALASLPDFDPNNIKLEMNKMDIKPHSFNQITQGSYELGSVMKIFTLAMALENERITLSDEFDTWKCIKKYRKTCLRDYRKSKTQYLNAAQCLEKSSNICMAQIALLVGLDEQKRFLKEAGLLDELFFELLETGSPDLPNPWNESSLITISFGQGIGVIPLSFVTATAAIVNGGYVIEPTLYQREKSYKTQAKLISSEVSESMKFSMRQVVKNGSGKKANIEGYYVIGKTGTADQPCKTGGYCGILTSFVGAFPGWDPEYIILISYDNPESKKNVRGSTSYWNAVPTAGNIIKLSAPLLNVVKDDRYEERQMESLTRLAEAPND